MNTKKQIVDKIYFILGEDQASSVFDKEGVVIPKINEIIDSICRCKITNLLNGTDIRWGLLDFLYTEKTVEIPKGARLMNDINDESISLTLSSTEGYEESGYIAIDGNIVSYDGIVGNSLNDISGVNGVHKSGSEVCPVYSYGDIIKITDIIDVKSGKLLEQKDFREDKTYWVAYYVIKPFNNQKFAIFYNTNWVFTISYLTKIETMEKDNDECGFPDDYGVKIIPYLVTGELLLETSEVAKGQSLLQKGYSALEDMYQYYATPVKKFRKSIKVRPMQDLY